MSQYEVTQGPLTLPPGIVVRLNEQQASVREHALKKCKNGAFEVLLPIQFKVGEVLEFDEVPNKAILAAFFPIDKIQELQQIDTNTKPAKEEKPSKRLNVNKANAGVTQPPEAAKD